MRRRTFWRVLPVFAVMVLTALSGVMAQEEVPPPGEATAPGPMDLFISFTRTQLEANGFSRQQAEVEGRAMVWWSKGEGAPLVLIHGVSDQAGTWFQVAPALANDYRVLLVDLPGHGESEPAAGPLPMSLVLSGFESWLQAHAVQPDGPPPILVGNSMGAWLATLVAQRHPAWVSRVVVVNGGPLRADSGELDLLPADREEARQLMAALRDPGSPPTPDPVLDDLVRRAPKGQVSRMFAAEEDLESYLFTEDRLGEITTPVDLLWGASDRFMGLDYPKRLLAGLPNARLARLEKCGHLPQAECPVPFTTALQAVLAQAPPRVAATDP